MPAVFVGCLFKELSALLAKRANFLPEIFNEEKERLKVVGSGLFQAIADRYRLRHSKIVLLQLLPGFLSKACVFTVSFASVFF